MLNKNQKEQPYVIYFSGIEQKLLFFFENCFGLK